MKRILGLCMILCTLFGAQAQQEGDTSSVVVHASDVLVGAERASIYLPELMGKRVALVVNQTSEVFGTHLVDFLISKDVNIVRVFAPEHGFRGNADAGERISDGVDPTSGVPIKSLYGKSKKPLSSDLVDVDIVVFDIQDVGVRFYTYISTMHYVMQACAENEVPFMVLDRPNPNGFYVDGPVLDMAYSSFVGMHPVALVHGLTVGEYAQMINTEGWLGEGLTCDLEVVLLTGWDHQMRYQLPIKPSPNLPNMTSVYLYPTFGLFEGTNVSVGRGTNYPFQVVGSPYQKPTDFSFVPESKPGAKYPKHKGKTCNGFDLRVFDDGFFDQPTIQLSLLLQVYANSTRPEAFFLTNHFYYKLAGNTKLEGQIKDQISPKDIRASWQKELVAYRKLRQKYLLYPDFK